MNFSLKAAGQRKSTPQKGPRLQLGSEGATTTEPESVSTLLPEADRERVIRPVSQKNWREAAAARRAACEDAAQVAAGTSATAFAPNVIEEMTYEEEVKARPDAPTERDYQELSIDDFGAALLRGLGGHSQKRPPTTQPRPRSKFAGIGASSPIGRADRASIADLEIPLIKHKRKALKSEPSNGDPNPD